MRPLTLRVSGFTCFREDQPALDFTSLDLFAITGPTGAGKSSVLDAITYALYGRVPRMGKQGVRELISHGRDRLTVMLAFAVGGQHYVMTRSTRRTGGTQCQLDALHGDRSTPIASGVKPVAEAVSRIVGLDYDAFTQAVLLPQGEFSRFLKGAAGDRRRILQELLRLTLYGRMREIAGQRHATARARSAALAQQLEGLAGMTPATLAILEGEHATVVASLEELRQAVERHRARREEVSRLVQLHHERQARVVELGALDESAPEQQTRVQRLDRARAAGVAVPLLDVLDRDDRAVRSRERSRKTAASEVRTAKTAAAGADRRTARAREAASSLPALRARIHALEALDGRLDHRAALETDHRRLTRELADAVALVGNEARRLEAAAAAQATATEQLVAADAHRRSIVVDTTELTACEARRDGALELRRDRLETEAMARRLRAATTAVDQARRVHAATAAQLNEAIAEHDRAVAEHEAARRHQQTSWDRQRAMILRAHLAPGHACPVCDQTVSVVPPVVAGPDQAEADAAVEETAEDVQHAIIRVRQRQEAASRAAAALEGSEADGRRLLAENVALATRIESSTTALCEDLRTYLPASHADEPEAWLLTRIETLRADRARSEAAERAWLVARELAAGADATRALVAQAHDARHRDVERLRGELASTQQALEAVQALIASVTDADDPRAELASLVSAAQRLEDEIDQARQAANAAALALVAASTRLADAERQVEEAVAARRASEAAALAVVARQGFDGPLDARQAWLDEATYAVLAQERDTWVATRSRLLARIEELDCALGPSPYGEADLLAITTACARADEALGAALRRRGELEAQIVAARRRLDDATVVRGRLAEARADLDVYGVLTADLQANAFQDWLLGEIFDRLVRGASVRLMELSNRYTLQWLDQEFYVVDHDNAGERRTADTLSGGETFLASLALALELSEQVQRAAGAVRLDSLFIDEGFGSLDADAQDVVAAAIESLQVSGRMVGIITHVRELTDRMPASILIDKRADGSRWSIRSALA